MNTKLLTTFIESRLVMCSWGDYEGIREPTVEDCLRLRALVEFALATATIEDIGA